MNGTSDFFIVKDKNLKMSEALIEASVCILEEINDMEETINNIKV
jgi:hypothetical protein